MATIPSKRRKSGGLSSLFWFTLVLAFAIGSSAIPVLLNRAKDAERTVVDESRKRQTKERELASAITEKSRIQNELNRYENLRIAMKVPAIDEAVEEYAELRDRQAWIESQQEALGNVGVASPSEAALRIAKLNNRVKAEERRAKDAERREAQLIALRDAQGWVSASCSLPQRQAPPGQQRQASNEVESTRILVCCCPL